MYQKKEKNRESNAWLHIATNLFSIFRSIHDTKRSQKRAAALKDKKKLGVVI